MSAYTTDSDLLILSLWCPPEWSSCAYMTGPFLYNIEPNVSWLDNNVRRVFDITDVGAIVNKLHIFYVD